MGCSSCGQRYRAARAAGPSNARVFARQQLLSKRRKAMVKDTGTPPSSGTIQAQPAAGVVIPGPTAALDPATGHEISVIKTGTCSEGSLGETTLAPIAAEEGYKHEAAETSAQEAAEHTSGGEEANG